MGKSTISTGPFSIAICMFTGGYGFNSPQDGINMGSTHKRWDQYGLISARKGDTERMLESIGYEQQNVGKSPSNIQ